MKKHRLEVTYSYWATEGDALEEVLATMEKKVGGKRQPIAMGGGAGDLDYIIRIGVPVIGFAAKPIIQKYIEGFFNADDVKRLGEKDRRAIDSWFQDLRVGLTMIVQSVRDVFRARPELGPAQEDRAVALSVGDPGTERCYAVLNAANMNETILDDLPVGIERVIKFLSESSLKGLVVLQIYPDFALGRWRYLFMPTEAGLGAGFVDRYVDLDDGIIRFLASPKQFIELFGVLPEDRKRLLLDPFL